MYSRSLEVTHLAYFLKVLCTCEIFHKMSPVSIEDETIFIWTVANHTGVHGIKRKTPFHPFYFVLFLPSQTHSHLPGQLQMMLFQLMSWWLRILLTFLGLGGSGELYYHFIQQYVSEIIHYRLFFFFPNQKHQSPLLFVLSSLDWLSLTFFFYLQEANSYKGSNLCFKSVKGEGLLHFIKYTSRC